MLSVLRNRRFALLYAAQVVNGLGDALTWVGLALLAFELAGHRVAEILAGTLTLRVLVYTGLGPLAGVLADRFDRRWLMVSTHLARLGLVGLLPSVTQPWQLYGIVLLLNGLAAIYVPTYKATIPQVTTPAETPQAIALANATTQLLGVLGPGLAGVLAAWVGNRSLFFWDGATFAVATLLLLRLPGQWSVRPRQATGSWGREMLTGTGCLLRDPLLRYGLLMQGVVAIAGAAILVNTVGYVQGTLRLGPPAYGYVMAALGLGAMGAALALMGCRVSGVEVPLLMGGGITLSLTLLPANQAGLGTLLVLWSVAGAGQTLVQVTTQTLMADRIALEMQGRVYGAHFAWSHLWWAVAYPTAGWLGRNVPESCFVSAGLASLAIWCVVNAVSFPHHWQPGQWHEHVHIHDQTHQHEHSRWESRHPEHSHPHFHATI